MMGLVEKDIKGGAEETRKVLQEMFYQLASELKQGGSKKSLSMLLLSNKRTKQYPEQLKTITMADEEAGVL